MNTLKNVVTGFPHKDIPKNLGLPTHTKVKELSLLLSSNAVSVYSNQGNGALDYQSLTVTPNTQITLSGILFQASANPDPTVVVPPVSTGSVIATIKRTYKRACEELDCFYQRRWRA